MQQLVKRQTSDIENAGPGAHASGVASIQQTAPQIGVTALTIAGSDSCGGAGIQMDLATFSHFGVFGASAITALTAQNTLGVAGVQITDPELVRAQIDAVLADLPVRAAKTGMLANAEIIETVVGSLGTGGIALVVDPVMIATSGARLLEDNAVEALRLRLLPRATLVTPNLPEAQVLTGLSRETDPGCLGRALLKIGCRAVLVKGGHGTGQIVEDWLITPDGEQVFEHPRQPGRIHGTGCCLSAGITAGLAKGMELADAVQAASKYLQALIRAARKPLQGDLLLLHRP